MNTATAITLAALAALTPTVTCLIGIILQRSDVRDLRSEVRDLRTDMLAMRKDIQGEMQAFRKDVHGDLLLIHEPVANVRPPKPLKTPVKPPATRKPHLSLLAS